MVFYISLYWWNLTGKRGDTLLFIVFKKIIRGGHIAKCLFTVLRGVFRRILSLLKGSFLLDENEQLLLYGVTWLIKTFQQTSRERTCLIPTPSQQFDISITDTVWYCTDNR